MSVEKEDLDSDDLEEPQESESNVWFCPIILVDILSRLYLYFWSSSRKLVIFVNNYKFLKFIVFEL